MKMALYKRVEKMMKNNPTTEDWMSFWESLGVEK